MILIDVGRRYLALGAAGLLLAGCNTNPNMLVASNTPSDLAHSGKAYVAFEMVRRQSGLISGGQHAGAGQFINTAATPNPFYLRTPDSMKLGTGPGPRDVVMAIDPGTYVLNSLALEGGPAFFGSDESPVAFKVAAGEVVYLGSLHYQSFAATNLLNPFKKPRFHVTFDVADELEAHRAALSPSLALLPGNPAIQTRLMTVRRAEVLVSSTKPNWLDTSKPVDDWAPATPPAPMPQAPDAVPQPPAAAPSPDSTAPWHEAPSP